MDRSDWRTQFQPASRHRIVNFIVDTLKRDVPPSNLKDIRNIAIQYEKKIFCSAKTQSDYLRQISLKMYCMKTTSHKNGVANVLPQCPARNSARPVTDVHDKLEKLSDEDLEKKIQEDLQTPSFDISRLICKEELKRKEKEAQDNMINIIESLNEKASQSSPTQQDYDETQELVKKLSVENAKLLTQSDFWWEFFEKFQTEKEDWEKKIEVLKTKLVGKWKKWTELEKERDECQRLLGKEVVKNAGLQRKLQELEMQLQGKDVLNSQVQMTLDKNYAGGMEMHHNESVKESSKKDLNEAAAAVVELHQLRSKGKNLNEVVGAVAEPLQLRSKKSRELNETATANVSLKSHGLNEAAANVRDKGKTQVQSPPSMVKNVEAKKRKLNTDNNSD